MTWIAKKCERILKTDYSENLDNYFDWEVRQAERIHMVSADALLGTSHRISNLDYHTLMKLTLELTKDFTEVEKLCRRMCFNVFAHNRDDHSKNFIYLYAEQEDRWKWN